MQQPPNMPPGAPPPGYGPPPGPYGGGPYGGGPYGGGPYGGGPYGGAPMGGPPGAMPPNPVSPSTQVSGPAIGLMVVGILMIVAAIGGILLNLLGAGLGAINAASGSNQFANLFSGVVGLVFSAIGLLLGGIVIFGGMKMKALQNYGLAMAAAIISLLPCTSGYCCLLGMPIGIWALVVLMNDNVKAAFR